MMWACFRSLQHVRKHFPFPLTRGIHKSHSKCSSGSEILCITDEVRSALRVGQPVVALESTIITHGMPFPDNLQTALEVENIIRKNGVIPATVAIVKGKIHIGLTHTELEWLASGSSGAVKASRRDMAFLISQGMTGGLTVSGTMVASHMAGIPLFVTGGIGGVHRGVDKTLDISADLRELGRTPVTVVSAGVKSILDIPKTLEYLETEGVSVLSYGPTTDFPAFFTPTSGSHAPYNVQTPLEAAKVIDVNRALNLDSGTLIAVPIPSEAAADEDEINKATEIATKEAVQQSIQGKDVTPFVLKRVNELMDGASLKSNIALIKNNAHIGSQIALALADLRKNRSNDAPSSASTRYNTDGRALVTGADIETTNDEEKCAKQDERVVVIGGINVDFTASFQECNVLPNGATYQGKVKQSFGGVGRNIADGLARLDQNPLLLSAAGEDMFLDMLKKECSHMDLSAVRHTTGHNSATYCAVLDHNGALIYGIGDFDEHRQITPDYISEHEDAIAKSPLVIFDGNITAESMQYITELCQKYNTPVFFEPTNVFFIPRLFASDAWRHLTYISPNLNELEVFHSAVTSGDFDVPLSGSTVETSAKETIDKVLELSRPILNHIPNILVTIGHHGVVLCRNTHFETPLPYSRELETQVSKSMSAIHMPVPPQDDDHHIVSVSGAGDCFNAAFVTSLVQRQSPSRCLAQGILGAGISLRSHRAVPENLTPQTIRLENIKRIKGWKEHVLLSGE